MPTLISQPAVIHAAGNKPKRIEEFAGRDAHEMEGPDPHSALENP